MQNWEIKRLSDICSIQTGKHDANHATETGKYRFYTCASQYLWCDTVRFSGECLILPGNGVNVGEVYYYNGDFDAYQRTYVISEISKDVYAKFLYYNMLLNWKQNGTAKQYGSATNFIKIGNFLEYEIPLPPLDEQKRIVKILDEKFAMLETVKANAKANLQNAKDLFQSQLTKAFSNTTWEKKRLGEVCSKIGSGATPKGGKESYKSEGIHLVRSMNVYDNEFIYDELACLDDNQAYELRNVELQEDDVLFNITGASVCRCCVLPSDVLPARVNQHVSILRPDHKILNPLFLCYSMIGPYHEELYKMACSGGSTRQAITKKQLEDLKSMFHPLRNKKS